jgi:RNA polymerase sigma-70 factor (ECF subfamily)
MSETGATCWTLIQGAAAGGGPEREEFAHRYASVVRAYLRARWKGGPLIREVDDVTQDVFLECFRGGGALEKVEQGRPGGFRAFLYGVVRNVARGHERRRARRRDEPKDASFHPDHLPSGGESPSEAFDRAWATAILAQAARRHTEAAGKSGGKARRRVELLRMRFQEGRPIREIAEHWNEDAAYLHRQYAKARREFRRALVEVVSFHHPGEPAEVERECARLIELL